MPRPPRLEAQLKAMSAQATVDKAAHIETRSFNPEGISEYKTRKHYIDWDLALAGWKIDENALEEREVTGMPREKDSDSGTGYIDYLLLGNQSRGDQRVQDAQALHRLGSCPRRLED